jgi:hypothetical protein
MNTLLSVSRRSLVSLFVSFVVLSCLAVRASAVTLSISAGLSNPNTSIFGGGDADSSPNFGWLDFGAHPDWGHVNSLGTLNFDLTIANLDTHVSGLAENHITLSLAGFDTGILLNGFGQFSTQQAFSNQTISNNAANILQALNDNNGLITVGLHNSVAHGGGNFFVFQSFNGQLSINGAEITPIPFTPVQTMGFALIGMGVAFRQLRRRGSWLAAFMRVRA